MASQSRPASPVIASVHIADVGTGEALGIVRHSVKPKSILGLRSARIAIAAPLTSSVKPPTSFGRVGLVAFWDDEAALDAFEAAHPLAAKLSGGWSARLEPLRAFGTWPGLPLTVPSSRVTSEDGPMLVLTLGQLRLRRLPRFLRTSAEAEGAIPTAKGVIFATGLAKPPFVATCSLWESSAALMEYAYGRTNPAHMHAIEADRKKPFHKQSAFVRFRPFDIRGSLAGKNPLPADRVEQASQ